METSAVSILWAAFQTSAACPVEHMAMRILSTIGAAFNSTLYLATRHLATRRGWPISSRRPKEPNATADRYINGRGMSFCLEDQKPQLKPPSSPLGLFFLVGSSLPRSQLGSSHQVQNENCQSTGKTHRRTHRRDHRSHHCFAGALAPSRRDSTRMAAKSPVLEHYKLSTEAAE
jgi:hypothetical protein